MADQQVEMEVLIKPNWSEYDKGLKKRSNVSVSGSGSSSSSSSSKSGGTDVLGTALGVAIGAEVGPALDGIQKVLNASLFYQKSMDALIKLISIGIRFIGDIIGGIVYTVFKLLLPIVKVLNQLWAPLQKQMLQGLKNVYKSTSDPIQRLIGATEVIGSTAADFFGILNNSISVTIVKALVDVSTKIAQILIVVIGGSLIAIIKILTWLAVLLATPFGKGQATQDFGDQLASSIGTGIAAYVGLLEVVDKTTQIAADQYLSSFIEKLVNVNGQVANNAGQLNDWGTTLQSVANIFDTGFGTKIKTVIDAVDQAASDAAVLVAAKKIDITTAFQGILGAMVDALGIKVPILETAFSNLLDAYQKLLDDKLKETQTKNRSVTPDQAATSLATAFLSAGNPLAGAVPGSFPRPPTAVQNLDMLQYYAQVQSGVAHDFIMRPGQAPQRISPNDTVTGMKGGQSNGGGANVNITINGNGDASLKKMIIDTMEGYMRTKFQSGYMKKAIG